MKYPKILLAMPVLNRVDVLPMTLEAIKCLNYPKKLLRIIFVDGGSTDGTFEVLQKFREENSNVFREIILLQKKTNIPQARNLCIKHLKDEDFVWFLDSDVIPQPDSLIRLISLADRGGDISSLYYSSFSYNPPKPEIKEIPLVGAGCTLIRREVIEKVGGFNEALYGNEDGDFCVRARKGGSE